MQDVKKPSNSLEAFEFWMNDMQTQFTHMPFAHSKKIEVKDANEVSESQKMQYLFNWRESGDLESLAKLYEANGNLKAANYVRTKLMEVL
jgi:hypothetical protein